MTDIEAANAPAQEGDPGLVTGASYYQRVGGAEAVKAAVGLFYDKVLADPELAGYFATVDMEQQRRHLALMLTVVLGGPNGYNGRGLAEAHQPLDIPVAHYALVGEHLMATLSELGAPADVLAHVGDVLVQVRDQVVGAGDRRGG